MRRGGEAVRVTITHKDKKDWWVFQQKKKQNTDSGFAFLSPFPWLPPRLGRWVEVLQHLGHDLEGEKAGEKAGRFFPPA